MIPGVSMSRNSLSMKQDEAMKMKLRLSSVASIPTGA